MHRTTQFRVEKRVNMLEHSQGFRCQLYNPGTLVAHVQVLASWVWLHTIGFCCKFFVISTLVDPVEHIDLRAIFVESHVVQS